MNSTEVSARAGNRREMIPHLDHVMVSLDPDAHRELLESPLLPGIFGRFKIKNAHSSMAGEYSSAGLAGHNTLIEFFHAESPVLPGTTGGLVLSFAVSGAVHRARKLLDERALTRPRYELVQRVSPGTSEPRPWYHLLRPELGEHSPFVVFLSEVTPEYLALLGAPMSDDGALRRDAYLDAALGEPPRPQHCLRDIARVTVRLRPERAAVVKATLIALGYRVLGGDRRELHGPDFTLRMDIDDHGAEGVSEVVVDLAGSALAGRELRFGDSCRLTVAPEGDSATWTFTPLRPL